MTSRKTSPGRSDDLSSSALKVNLERTAATIGNAGAFARQLIDAEVEVVSVSGAPQAEKHFLFLNPWDSAATVASQLLEAAIKRGCGPSSTPNRGG